MRAKKNTNSGTPTGGFTLIEILVVIGIIAVLAGIVIIAINPAKQFAQARNTQRTSNVNAILNAIGQRMADNKGIFEGTFSIGSATSTCPQLPASSTPITSVMASNSSETSGNLGCLVPTYISSLPTEPTPSGIQYTVEELSSGRIQVCAPEARNEDSIPNAEPICVVR